MILFGSGQQRVCILQLQKQPQKGGKQALQKLTVKICEVFRKT